MNMIHDSISWAGWTSNPWWGVPGVASVMSLSWQGHREHLFIQHLINIRLHGHAMLHSVYPITLCLWMKVLFPDWFLHRACGSISIELDHLPYAHTVVNVICASNILGNSGLEILASRPFVFHAMWAKKRSVQSSGTNLTRFKLHLLVTGSKSTAERKLR